MKIPAMPTKAIPWPRMLAQSLVIVASVMAALAADRWARSLDDRATTRAHLEQLRVDFLENQKMADAAVQAKQKRAVAAETALGAVEGRKDRPPDAPLLPVAVELAGWNLTPHYLDEAWDDLLSTGDVRLIHNRDVRAAIAGFYRSVRSASDFESEWRTYVQSYRASTLGVLDPYLRLRILQLYPDNMVADSLGPRDNDDAILLRLRRHQDIGGKLADVIMVQRTGAQLYEQHSENIAHILTLLDTELAKTSRRK
jgi:hypothetical protein